jgi:hypothetical protein
VSPEIWTETITVPPRRDGEGNQAIPALYARERVADLETRWTIGNDQYQIDREIEAIGCEFQISTRLTSWVAVDEISKVSGRERHEVVPQNLPYGTSAQSFGLRQAAADKQGRLVAGVMPMQAQMMKTMAATVTLESEDDFDYGEAAPSGMVGDLEVGAGFDDEVATGSRSFGGEAMPEDTTLGPPMAQTKVPAGAPSSPMLARAQQAPGGERAKDAPAPATPAASRPEAREPVFRKRGAGGPQMLSGRAPMAPPPSDPMETLNAPMFHAAAPLARAKRGTRIWLVLALLLAVIAALVWWLFL